MDQKPTPEMFLADYPLEIQGVAQTLRALVKETVPGVSEAVFPGWQLIGYRVKRDRKDAYFGFIAPKQDEVTLGFEYGVLLSDPQQLLEGQGKQVRQLVVKAPEDIREEAFRALIMEAAEIALLPKGEKEKRFLQHNAEQDAHKQEGMDGI